MGERKSAFQVLFRFGDSAGVEFQALHMVSALLRGVASSASPGVFFNRFSHIYPYLMYLVLWWHAAHTLSTHAEGVGLEALVWGLGCLSISAV